jgi:hypothetical protein
MTPYKLIINWPKIDQKLTCHGGVENCQNRSFLTGGVRGGHFYKFFEISHFFAKTFTFRTPKSTPKIDAIENAIPHKNACTFRPMGVKKCHFLGGRGADRSDRKM